MCHLAYKILFKKKELWDHGCRAIKHKGPKNEKTQGQYGSITPKQPNHEKEKCLPKQPMTKILDTAAIDVLKKMGQGNARKQWKREKDPTEKRVSTGGPLQTRKEEGISIWENRGEDSHNHQHKKDTKHSIHMEDVACSTKSTPHELAKLFIIDFKDKLRQESSQK